MLISAVLQNIQTLIDLFWVGKLGSIAIASVATSGTILMILFPIVVGISSGTIAIVSRYIGSKNYDFANHVVGQSLFLSFFFGILIGIVGFFISGPLFYILRTPAEVVRYGDVYLKICLLGTFISFGFFIGAVMMAIVSGFGTSAIAAYGTALKMQ